MLVRYRVATVLASVLVPVLLAGCTRTDHDDSPTPPPDATESSPLTAAPTPSRTPTDFQVPPALARYCHTGFPLEGVYSPQRLTVKQSCAAVTGVASEINREHDDDLHISLTGVDPKWLNQGNLERPDRALVVEAVPSIPIRMPPVGSRVTIVGPWVLDTETGWLEIHPVWAILPA